MNGDDGIAEALVQILNLIGSGVVVDGLDDLTRSMESYNPALYNAMVIIHQFAVKPVTAIVLSIMAVLMLATNSAKVEGDRELGVRIIAATMFKLAMVVIVSQNAMLILQAIAAIGTTITTSAIALDTGTGAATGEQLGDSMRADLEDGDIVAQLGMLVILLLPFIVAGIASVIAIVMILFRFLQLYMMGAFASLPLAFFAHDDTKPIAIGYLKRFGVTVISGVMIVLAVKFYQAVIGNAAVTQPVYDGDLWGFAIGNFGTFFVAPILLIVIMFSAHGLAKAIVGEG